MGNQPPSLKKSNAFECTVTAVPLKVHGFQAGFQGDCTFRFLTPGGGASHSFTICIDLTVVVVVTLCSLSASPSATASVD